MTDYDEQIVKLHRKRDEIEHYAGLSARRWSELRSDVEAQIKELAEAKLEAAKRTAQGLTDEHRGYAWLDADGDRWEYHDGKWLCDEGGATSEFAPYTRVEPVVAVEVGSLLDDPNHRLRAWIDAEGDRWEWREGKWQWRRPGDGDDNWHASGIIKPNASEGPFRQVAK